MTLTAERPTLNATLNAPRNATWQSVCALESLEPLWAEVALVDREQIALVRLPSDEVVAVSHWDPYAKAHVMARGIVGSKAGRPTLASPLHKQVYDLATGECLTDPTLKLATFPVRVRDRVVEVLAA